VPTANGKLQLQDYDAALTARGFDGYQPNERYQLINFGYRYIARQYPWSWAQATFTYAVTPGTGFVAISGASTLGADNINEVYVTTDPYRRKLKPLRQEVFESVWLPLDLTISDNRGIPDHYYVFNGNLYILPPPQSAMNVLVYFQNFLPDMVAATDAPVTPQVLDEVILDAALVRAHRRSHELQLAADAQQRVDEAIMDMLADDTWLMGELQERVIPDNQWL
jgi:hypothetical protein